MRGDASDAQLMTTTLRRGGRALQLRQSRLPPLGARLATHQPGADSRRPRTRGAVLVTVSNLYGYGPATVHRRADLRRRASHDRGHAARGPVHQGSGARSACGANNERPSTRVEPKSSRSRLGLHRTPSRQRRRSRFVPRVLAGRSVTTIGRSDVAHTFTYTEDVARLAVTVGADPRAWGKAWHAPSNEPRTQQEVANDVSAYAGVRAVRVRALSRASALHTRTRIAPDARTA